MKRSILQLNSFSDGSTENTYRTVFKNQHGRTLFLSLALDGTKCSILDCFYTDRNQGKSEAQRRNVRPLLLKSFSFPTDKLLSVIEAELDKLFYGVEFTEDDTRELPLAEYLAVRSSDRIRKYHFLILEGSGNSVNGLPSTLRTRLKNKLHRSVYLELCYFGDGKGVVKECYYYDRSYIRQDIRVMPPMLTSCFFPYDRQHIIDLVNNEICCNFTHIIITNGNEGVDIGSDPTPICGAI
ncbi:MAG: hypothetical protein J6A16_08220 [Oscillospiraceae bacterium]|nr:hypothetical protein [Oscillospiraceae bacterium]MBP3309282.1 hypothetical protein [Ruminococcus sp.]